MMAEHPEPSAPEISIVIPVRNEEHTIGAAVSSALRQRGAPPLEVVVADGDSSDRTRAVVAAIAHDDSRVRLISNPERKTPAGLNAAIRAARGGVLVRCDAHSVLPADYVATALNVLAATGADVVGGTMRAAGKRFWQRAIAIALSTPVGVGDARFHTGGRPGPVDTVYLGVFRRDAFKRAGLFDESLERNQDYELNYRIRETGGEVYFDPALAVDYVPRTSLGALARQYRQYGMWKRLVLRRFPDSVRWRQLAAPLLVVGLIASIVIFLVGLPLPAALVPGAYLLALIGTAMVELVRRRDVAALVLPLVLPTMHLSWAFGFMTSDLVDRGPSIPKLDL